MPEATPVDALRAMSVQARLALKRAGFWSLEEAARRPDAELLGLKGFGQSSLVRLRAWAADPTAAQAPLAKTASPLADKLTKLAESVRKTEAQLGILMQATKRGGSGAR